MGPEPFGSFHPLTAASRVVGSTALVAALGLAVWLQRVQLEMRRAERSVWWVSNGRDLINACALAAILGALWLVGFPVGSALLVGATVLLAVNLFLRAVLLRTPWRAKGLLAFGLALVLAAVVLVAPERVHELANLAAARLFD